MNKLYVLPMIVALALSACAPTAPPPNAPNAAVMAENATLKTQVAQLQAASKPTETLEPTAIPTDAPAEPTATAAPAALAAPAPALIDAPPAPADGSDYQGSDSCKEGIISNQYADIARIPFGTLEGSIVAEISWTGSGFGGFDRAVVVVPRMTSETMAFVRNSRTIHLVQYCGFLKDIMAWAPSHVDALVQSSQDDNGKRPNPQEIGVYYVDLHGAWTVVREGPMGPGLEYVKQRVVMTPVQ